MPDLSSALEKLRRAKIHIQEAQAIEQRFINSQFYTTAVKRRGQGRFAIELASLEKLPVDLALALGDAAHCLRSALDHIAFACVKKKLTGDEERGVAFPICSTKKNFRASKRWLKHLPKRAASLVDTFQPYHRRKQPDAIQLSILQTINDWDKHRMLPITASHVKRSTFTVSGTDGITAIKTYRGRMKVGAVLARFEAKNRMDGHDVKMAGKLVIVPRFEDRMPRDVVNKTAINSLVFAYNFIKTRVIPAFTALK